MSRISSCPSCQGDLLIPGSAQASDQMRCPRCGTPFAVADVLEASIPAPPEAIPIEHPHPMITAAVGPHLSRVEAPLEWDTEPIAVPPRPQRKQPSVFAHLVGIVGGGLLGLSLGYLGLLRFGGPQYDFLNIAGRLPAWVMAPLPRFGGGPVKDGDQKRGRELKDLLDAPDEPPAVDLPVAPGDAPPVGPPPDKAAPFGTPAPPVAPATDPPSAAAPENEAAAQPAPFGPKEFTPHSTDELALALADAAGSLGCPACHSTGYVTRTVVTGTRERSGEKIEQTAERRIVCDTCGGKPVTKMTPEAYSRMCHLAEVVTFVTSGDSNAPALREGLQGVLAGIGADQRAAESIGRLAGFQLDEANRKQNGIALAGTVQQLSREGNLYTMRVVLFGLPKVVTVVSWRPAQPVIKEHDRVLILGSIVDNPAENLMGYEGHLPQVVWGGLPARLPAGQ
ncbi:MAG: hypothetical protein HYX69_03780 [Planctomycetia bacterium]|nr:hypothetical protein [Planctomycetia bacterium]